MLFVDFINVRILTIGRVEDYVPSKNRRIMLAWIAATFTVIPAIAAPAVSPFYRAPSSLPAAVPTAVAAAPAASPSPPPSNPLRRDFYDRDDLYLREVQLRP